jgi:UDP-glucose 4-epimerase
MSTPRPQRLFVTGGRGRLASLVADHFRAPAHAVTLFSRAGGTGFQTFESLAQPAVLAEADAVFHLAWSTLPATSERDGGSETQVDLPALENILRALAALPAGARPLFVFFSSGGTVYGNAPGRPNVETDLCHPIGHYGRAKVAAEEIVNRYAAQHGLRCTILRVSNPYGYPVPSSRAQGLIPHALRCGVTGQPLTLWGDGSAQKDFLYYTDFLSALELVLSRRLTGTFNLSAGESHRVDEVIRLAEQELERPIALQRTTAPAWDVHDSRLANDKFRAAAGWGPQVPLVEGIRRAATGYAAH